MVLNFVFKVHIRCILYTVLVKENFPLKYFTLSSDIHCSRKYNPRNKFTSRFRILRAGREQLIPKFSLETCNNSHLITVT